MFTLTQFLFIYRWLSLCISFASESLEGCAHWARGDPGAEQGLPWKDAVARGCSGLSPVWLDQDRPAEVPHSSTSAGDSPSGVVGRKTVKSHLRSDLCDREATVGILLRCSPLPEKRNKKNKKISSNWFLRHLLCTCNLVTGIGAVSLITRAWRPLGLTSACCLVGNPGRSKVGQRHFWSWGLYIDDGALWEDESVAIESDIR